MWSPRADLNRRPRPYQGRALPTELHGRGGMELEKSFKSKEMFFFVK